MTGRSGDRKCDLKHRNTLTIPLHHRLTLCSYFACSHKKHYNGVTPQVIRAQHSCLSYVSGPGRVLNMFLVNLIHHLPYIVLLFCMCYHKKHHTTPYPYNVGHNKPNTDSHQITNLTHSTSYFIFINSLSYIVIDTIQMHFRKQKNNIESHHEI